MWKVFEQKRRKNVRHGKCFCWWYVLKGYVMKCLQPRLQRDLLFYLGIPCFCEWPWCICSWFPLLVMTVVQQYNTEAIGRSICWYLVSALGSYQAKTCGWVRCSLMFRNALATWFIVVMNLLSSVKVVGGAMLRMVFTLLGSGETVNHVTRNLRLVQWTCTFLYPGWSRQSQGTSKFRVDIDPELLSQHRLQSVPYLSWCCDRSQLTYPFNDTTTQQWASTASLCLC